MMRTAGNNEKAHRMRPVRFIYGPENHALQIKPGDGLHSRLLFFLSAI